MGVAEPSSGSHQSTYHSLILRTRHWSQLEAALGIAKTPVPLGRRERVGSMIERDASLRVGGWKKGGNHVLGFVMARASADSTPRVGS